ncbi:MAG TPA: hypothetical protein V6C85_06830, partial [Allocoleopsis sp.]
FCPSFHSPLALFILQAVHCLDFISQMLYFICAIACVLRKMWVMHRLRGEGWTTDNGQRTIENQYVRSPSLEQEGHWVRRLLAYVTSEASHTTS